jgi:hypothetical protein
MRHEQLFLFAIFLGANNFDRFSQRQPEKLQLIILEMVAGRTRDSAEP